MPVYEQKLISPLAIRFTQEHIRTTFQDGRIVEDSIEQIDVRPAAIGSDYDLVLTAPFPAIEILRWHPPRATSKAKKRHDSSEHWFTIDNRRLYCLQRAAMKHWPRRVAAVVDILYADHGRIYRKYDSTTFGHSVSIGHSFKGPEVDFWDWSLEAEASASVSNISNAAAAQTAKRDDQRASIDALNNAEGESSGILSSSILRLLQMEDSKTKTDRQVTPSTSQADSQDFAFESGADHAFEEAETSEDDAPVDLFAASDSHLTCGTWMDEDGTLYIIHPSTQGKADWACSRQHAGGNHKSISLFYDWDYDLIWWGAAGSYFASAAELHDTGDCIRWYGRKDEQMRKPKFSLRLQDGEIPWKIQEAAVPSKVDSLAATALNEIVEALKDLDTEEGYVWIDGWNERYGKHGLGQLRTFLEQHPDIFCVTPKRGKAFSIFLVEPTASKRGTDDRRKKHLKKKV